MVHTCPCECDSAVYTRAANLLLPPYLECVKGLKWSCLTQSDKFGMHCNFNRHQEALGDFSTALERLRGNLLIDYKQLGLIYKLYSVEVCVCVCVCMLP